MLFSLVLFEIEQICYSKLKKRLRIRQMPFPLLFKNHTHQNDKSKSVCHSGRLIHEIVA